MTAVDRHFSHEQVARYVQRIGMPEAPRVDSEWLALVQRMHLRNVPFEALDICPLSQRISLEPVSLYEKIVEQRRGGYCFELNGLLALILEDVGFTVERHEARFIEAARNGKTVYDHLVLTVSIPGNRRRWLVDVGAGRESPDGIVPLGNFADDKRYCAAYDDPHWYLTERLGDGSGLGIFEWRPTRYALSRFAKRSRDLETDPHSHFRQAPICTIVTEGGRDTISRWTLIETRGDQRTERQIADLSEMQYLLQERFGIDLALEHWWGGNSG